MTGSVPISTTDKAGSFDIQLPAGVTTWSALPWIGDSNADGVLSDAERTQWNVSLLADSSQAEMLANQASQLISAGIDAILFSVGSTTAATDIQKLISAPWQSLNMGQSGLNIQVDLSNVLLSAKATGASARVDLSQFKVSGSGADSVLAVNAPALKGLDGSLSVADINRLGVQSVMASSTDPLALTLQDAATLNAFIGDANGNGILTADENKQLTVNLLVPPSRLMEAATTASPVDFASLKSHGVDLMLLDLSKVTTGDIHAAINTDRQGLSQRVTINSAQVAQLKWADASTMPAGTDLVVDLSDQMVGLNGMYRSKLELLNLGRLGVHGMEVAGLRQDVTDRLSHDAITLIGSGDQWDGWNTEGGAPGMLLTTSPIPSLAFSTPTTMMAAATSLTSVRPRP